jgi:diaminopimelate decarboxylase
MERQIHAAAVEAAGTPVWIFDVDRIVENARTLREALGVGTISYAIKANDHPAVLEAAKRGGIGAEAASGREYALARAAGFSGAEIVFNGPLKTDEELSGALAEGALINADSLEEVARIGEIAGDDARVGIRVQSNLIEGAVGDRFGLSAEEAVEAVGLLRRRGLSLEQLHTHLGSYAVQEVDGPTAKRVDLIWPRGAELTVALAARTIEIAALLAQKDMEPASISLGGGLPVMPAAAEHFAAAREELQKSGLRSRLAFEPGRAVVSDAVALVCRVVRVRTPDRDGRQQVVVDAGVNLLPTVEWRDAQLSMLDGRGGEPETVVFGPLCLQSDVLAWKARLPQLEVGDLLVAENVGAYNWGRSTPFIFPKAPVALHRAGQLSIEAEPE